MVKIENAKYARLQQSKYAKAFNLWVLEERSKITKNTGEWFVKEKVADGVGFEPTVRASRTPVFKTGALNHSAIHPGSVLSNPKLNRKR